MIDTIRVLAKDKISILKDSVLGKEIIEKYQPIHANVTSRMDKMDDDMKKKYEEAKTVYESLK